MHSRSFCNTRGHTLRKPPKKQGSVLSSEPLRSLGKEAKKAQKSKEIPCKQGKEDQGRGAKTHPKSRITPRKTPRLHKLFRKVLVNFCLLPCDTVRRVRNTPEIVQKTYSDDLFYFGWIFSQVDYSPPVNCRSPVSRAGCSFSVPWDEIIVILGCVAPRPVASNRLKLVKWACS